ncbi:PHD and RING finger domain-containing protein 1-like [Cydia amplana]|uniref:PHD and RING finger domain-containing protein 1-like n=1 Tax=Cydia amplana TaxID=1869771 RepID=UPI002FE5330F
MSEDGSEGSATPPRPQRRIKKVMVLSSASESDSDESDGPTRTRKRRLRVVSEDEGASSSGSSVGARRRRALPQLRDSDADSDGSVGPAPSAPPKPASGFASDSSEGNSDKCSICLMRFTEQEVGTPANCEHIFCLDCITEWSKNVNTCPVDRITFDSIVVRTCAGGRVLRSDPVQVTDRRPSVEMLVIEDPTVCEICGSMENEDSMLLCDGCDLGFHMHCLTPPLLEIPIDQWHCASCISRGLHNIGSLEDIIYLSEVDDLFTGIADMELPQGPRAVPLRQPREVRRSSRNQSTDEPSTSSGRRGAPSDSGGARRARAPPRRRRKPARRRTNTVIIEYEIEENGKFPITRRVKRTVRKRKIRKRRPRTAARRTLVRQSVRAQLAALAAPHPAPVTASAGVTDLHVRRARAGIPTLNLFGSERDLEYFSDEDVASEGASTVARAVRPNAAVFSAYRQARRKMVSVPSPPHAAAAPDLLSDILESQTLLHSKRSVVSVTVDGQFSVKLRGEGRVDVTAPDLLSDILESQTLLHSKRSVVSVTVDGQFSVKLRGEAAPDLLSDILESQTLLHSKRSVVSVTVDGQFSVKLRGEAAPDLLSDILESQTLLHSKRSVVSVTVDGQFSVKLRGEAAPDLLSDILESQTLLHSKRSVVSVTVDGQFSVKLRGEAAPDLLSDILESQTLLHSKRSVVSVTVDGQFSVKLRGEGRVDVTKASDPPVRSAPAHGQRGGWGGGYSGNYHREQSANNFGRGISFDGRSVDRYSYGPNGGESNYPNRGNYGGARREEEWGGAPRRGHAPCPPGPAPGPPGPAPCARPRRLEPRHHAPPHRLDNRHSLGPAWPRARPEAPGPHRHSFGGFDNPLDMRVAPHPNPGPAQDRPFRPLPEPPVFAFDKLPEEKSEDGSDSSLVIDTEKYDPTEPTHDDDEEEEPPQTSAPVFGPLPAPPVPPKIDSPPKSPEITPPPTPITSVPPLPPAPPLPAGLLDTAVRQVLQEHRALMEPPQNNSDDDSDGDCPNFSIYSATSVHIASAGSLAPPTMRTKPDLDMTDLVQEDDEPLKSPEEEIKTPEPTPTKKDEYKEKVSKRCPITPNTRDPIKIKLNTPSLIKRVSLYDDEVAEQTEEPSTEDPEAPEPTSDEVKTSEEPPEDDKDSDKTPMVTDENKEDDNEEKDDKEDKGEDNEDKQEEEENADEAKVRSPSPREDRTPERPAEDLEEGERQNGTATPTTERSPTPHSPRSDDGTEKELAAIADGENTEAPEKMTESISETEDERSYTPCLDENQSKDDLRLEGEALGTEMISEDEANGVFSDAAGSPTPEPDGKKKKRKEGKKDGKTKSKGKKDIAFRKLSKAGRERSYRDKDRRRRSASASPRRAASERRRREKRKDLERYDVRSVVTEKRKKQKDPFGRDVSPARSASHSPQPERRSLSRPRRSLSRPRRSLSRVRRSLSRVRRSLSRPRRSLSRAKRSISRRLTPSPRIRRASLRSLTPLSPRGSPPRRSVSPRRVRKRRKSPSPRRRVSPRRREPSPVRARKRRRSASPKKAGKKKKRARSPPAAAPRRREELRRKSPKRKKKRRSRSRSPELSPGPPAGWSPLSVDSRLLSPRTPPPDASPAKRLGKRKRKEPRRRERIKHKRGKDQPAPSKEVFTSGDNILVSVSFAEQQKTAGPAERRKHREARREKRKRRRIAPAEDTAKPVAIIDLERSPFRELTPSPKNVIVLSDSDHGEKEPAVQKEPEPAPAAPAFVLGAVGPKTPPEPAAQPAPAPVKFSLAAKPGAAPRAANPLREDEEPAPAEVENGPNTPPEPPDSPDAYDPFEPTRSASASPARAASPAAAEPSPERPSMTLEAAQRTNLSADEVIARRPLSPIEKVMALLQSTRDESPEPVPASGPHLPAPATPAPTPAPAPPAPRILLPEPTRAQPKLFLAKPSPIKSNPIKPMQATKISMLPLPRRDGDSPYSPGSSDFGDLFSPPPAGRRDAFDTLFGARPIKRKDKSHAKVPVKFNRKKGKGNKTQVGVKIDDDNLKILDELPSSAVEMQVKSKFLKKLNRQERVVEEVKLVLKPHYTRKRVSKEEYKDILRRAVPKICHNKTGEINPAKIQALVEAYVKKARKKHKLGLA